MSEAKFNFEGQQIMIQCSKDDLMKDICLKLSIKINKDLNNLYFLYGGNILNLNKKLNELGSNEINILVYEKEKEGIKCPNCGKYFNNNIYNDILTSNKKTIDVLRGLKIQIDNIVNSNINDINNIMLLINNINIVLDNVIKDMKNNYNKININYINSNQVNNNNTNNKNIIEGIITIKSTDINKKIRLYKSKYDIDVYINNEKINMINGKGDMKFYNFKNEGNYSFKLIFKNDNITDLKALFESCNEISFIDLSNFNSSNVTIMRDLFNCCSKLKEIKGINILNTNNAINMYGMFSNCSKLTYLDLSNFHTSNVTDMTFMFCNCSELKEIKGINNFKTNNVTSMDRMFSGCEELRYLDLSNFNTEKVVNMFKMFYNCKKLELLNIKNFKINDNCQKKDMFKYINEYCTIIKN